jgi:hypothetical protein
MRKRKKIFHKQYKTHYTTFYPHCSCFSLCTLEISCLRALPQCIFQESKSSSSRKPDEKAVVGEIQCIATASIPFSECKQSGSFYYLFPETVAMRILQSPGLREACAFSSKNVTIHRSAPPGKLLVRSKKVISQEM